MTRCKDIQALFMDAVDETLSLSRRENFQNHVNGCAACREGFNAYKNAVDRMNVSPLFDPGMKPFESVMETMRGTQTVLKFPVARHASLSMWLTASVFCAAALLVTYTGVFQKESRLNDAQMAAFLMQNQTESFTLLETQVAFSGYDQLLAYGNTSQNSWESMLTEFGL